MCLLGAMSVQPVVCMSGVQALLSVAKHGQMLVGNHCASKHDACGCTESKLHGVQKLVPVHLDPSQEETR